MPRFVLLLALLMVGCLESSETVCKFGTCPSDKRCDETHKSCVFPDQLKTCIDQPDNTACDVGTQDGVCVGEVCLVRGCGDRVLSGVEQCDGDSLFINDATDCMDIGYYSPGSITCRDDCTIDVSQCEHRCGDGVLDTGEACDYAMNVTTSCVAAGFYAGEAACTPQCTLDISTCERCGDGALNGDEVCEGDTFPDSSSCYAFGYDGGKLGCTSACTGELGECKQYGFVSVSAGHFIPTGAWQADRAHTFLVGADSDTQGRIYVYDGRDVTEVGAAGIGRALDAVSGTSATDVWAVGDTVLVHYDGTSSVVTPLTVALPSAVLGRMSAVSAVAPHDVYAASKDGYVYHYDGAAWSSLDFKVDNNYLSVIGFTSGEVFAGAANGKVLHIHGGTQTSDLLSGNVNALWGSSASDVYAVCDTGKAFHYNGTSWSSVVLPDVGPIKLTSVWGVSSDDVTIVGQGKVFHSDGAGFSAIDAANAVNPLVFASSAHGTGILVGVASTTTGALLYRWGGAGVVIDGASLDPFAAAWSAGSTHLYAITNDAAPHGQLVTWDGTQWDEPLNGAVDGVWGASSAAVFAYGPAGLYRSTTGGITWTLFPAAPNTSNNEFGSYISGISATDVFILTSDGDLVHFNGTGLTQVGDVGDSATALYVADDTHVFAATPDGVVLYNGSTTTMTFDAPTLPVRGVWGSSSTNVYAIYDDTKIAHYDGAQWTLEQLPLHIAPLQISGTAANDVWLANDEGLLHFDGDRWTPVRTSRSAITALWAGAHEVFVGSNTGKNEHIVRACTTCL